ncbi:MAG: hypothetical protein ACFFCW_16245 [Candidatus Hodarchaeota archaeon]
MPEHKSKIKQLVPAGGWNVRYWSSKEPYYQLRRLIAFALVEIEETGDTRLDAIDEDEHRCKMRDEFGGYVFADDITKQFLNSSKKMGKRHFEKA